MTASTACRYVWLTIGTWLAFIAAATYAGIAAFQLHQMGKANKVASDSFVQTMGEMKAQTIAQQVAANAAKSAADTATKAMEIGNRPWIKIKHRIISPLTFDVAGRIGSPIALMTVEDTIENVGQSVALNVFSWEDVLPIDLDHSTKTARARQEKWCGANRHRSPKGLSGYMLFPREPWVQYSEVGPSMATLPPYIVHGNDSRLNGKLGFVLVGCVCYRSPLDQSISPAHETRFMYYLGIPQEQGFFPFILPKGIATQLRLIEMPDGFSAD